MKTAYWLIPVVVAVAAVVGAAVATVDRSRPQPESVFSTAPSPSAESSATPTPFTSSSPEQSAPEQPALEQPSPTQSFSAQSSPTPVTSTPTVSPSPSEPLSDRDRVSINGIGAVRIGMTVEEAARAAGVALVSEGASGSPGCSYVRPQGEPRDIGFMVINGTIARVDIWQDSSIKTVSGIGVGSTEAEILARFPGQIEVTPHEYTDGHYLTFVPRDGSDRNYRLVFETDLPENGRVTQFRAGRLPEVNFVEGCS